MAAVATHGVNIWDLTIATQLAHALAGRKLDITRRKIKTRRDKEDRQEKIAKEEDRKQRREDYLIDSRSQWQENNQELIDEYERYVDR